jgi:hypothetical protein
MTPMNCLKQIMFHPINFALYQTSDRTQLTAAVPATHTALLTSCVLAYVPTVHMNPLPPPLRYMAKLLDKGSRFA